MKKTFTVLLFFVALATMSFVISNDDPPLFKNLKVLPKDITKDQLDSVMHHFSASLGQKCGFCHVYNQEEKKMDFVSDSKQQKETARDMWKMMVKLNKKFFEVKDSKYIGTKLDVTCFTCHHGDEHPSTVPPKKMEPPSGGMHPQGPPPTGTDSTKHQ